MPNLKALSVLVTCLALFTHLSAQDPFFSQFFANRVYLNPAYTGIDPGSTLTLNYRDQWFGLADGTSAPTIDGFRTYNATYNYQVPCFNRLENTRLGLAGSAFHDATGAAPMTITGGALSASLEQQLVGINTRKGSVKSKFRDLSLRAGFQYGWSKRRMIRDYTIYSYQLHPIDGLDPLTATSGEPLESSGYGNLNVGFMVRGGVQWDKYSYTRFTLGFSVNNVNQPDVSLENAANAVPLPMRTTIHGGFTMQFGGSRGSGESWYLSPQFRLDRQLDGLLNTQVIGAYAITRATRTGAFLQYNSSRGEVTNSGIPTPFRASNTTTLILHSSIDLRYFTDMGKPRRKRKQGLILGFTYDVALGSLDTGTTTGGLEVNLRMNFQSGTRNRRNCLSLAQGELYKGGCPWRY
jgi:type IX secretion system PorP/SprF family membrane protein